MKRTAAIVLVALLTACATKKTDENDVPSLVPPPETSSSAAANAASDARLAEMQTSMTELLERIDVLNARIARLEASPQSEARVAVQQSPRVVEPAPRAVVESATVPAPLRAPQTVSGPLQNAAIADNYRGALILFGKGRMADARAALKEVFDADPSGELADNALYWIGETYYAASDFKSAMAAYERVTKEYPEQNKAPDAMFKIGLTFEKTGDLGMARKTFDEVIRRYPYSTAASSAKLELKRVKY
jgi:tol-pal system protein YbgF